MLLAVLACETPAELAEREPEQTLEVETDSPLARLYPSGPTRTPVPYVSMDTEAPLDTGYQLGQDRVTGTEHSFFKVLDNGDFYAATHHERQAAEERGIYLVQGPISGEHDLLEVGELVMPAPLFDFGAWGKTVPWGPTGMAMQGYYELYLYEDFTEPVAHLDVSTGWNIEVHDMTGDGVEDVVFTQGFKGAVDPSAVQILDGTFRGEGDNSDLTAYISPGTVGDWGWSILTPGDLDGDGVSDLVVSTWQSYIYHGPLTGFPAAADYDGLVANTGGDVVSPGDVDGDGLPELAGIQTHEHGAGWVMSATGAGDADADEGDRYSCEGVTSHVVWTLQPVTVEGSAWLAFGTFLPDSLLNHVWAVPAAVDGATHSCIDEGVRRRNYGARVGRAAAYREEAGQTHLLLHGGDVLPYNRVGEYGYSAMLVPSREYANWGIE